MAIDDDGDWRELRWRVVKTLLEANHRTNESLEQFYYQQHYQDSDQAAHLEEPIRELIARHESIQENLEELLVVIDEFDES